MTTSTPPPAGYCQCGCGQRTKLARQSDTKLGWVRGEPIRYVLGHHRRKSGVEYVVDEGTGCWIWQRALSGTGYGSVRDRRGGPCSAHQLFYERYYGPVPEGCNIDHLCRNRACVNPDHLEVVPQAVNVQRGRHAKLTTQAVLAIRASDEPRHVLASRYGVSQVTIENVRARKTWRNV